MGKSTPKGTVKLYHSFVPAKKGKFVADTNGIKDIRTGKSLTESLDNAQEYTDTAIHDLFEGDSGKIKSDILPSYVDDVLEYASMENFPETGESGKIYVATDTGISYRWSGSVYIKFDANAVFPVEIEINFPDGYNPETDQPTITFNHTFAEMQAAHNAGKIVYLIAGNGAVYNIAYIDNGCIEFVLNDSSYKTAHCIRIWSENDEDTYRYYEYQLADVATSGSYNDLTDKPEIPDANDYDILHDPRYSWRTPTKDEWEYLLNTRSASTVNGVANARYAKCTVNGVNGLLILPDVFTLPNGLTMANINTDNAAFTGNTYTLKQWELLKAAGCAFLSAAGNRNGSESYEAGSLGYYWSASLYESDQYGRAWYVLCGSDYQYVGLDFRNDGLSVRAVRSHENGTFSLSASTKADIAPANLQYHCKENRWRFAPNAYDYIGKDNANAAAGYDGWIDLFGWGTSGWDGSQANAKMPYSTSNTISDYYPDGDGTHDLTGDYARADWAVFASKGNYMTVEEVTALINSLTATT